MRDIQEPARAFLEKYHRDDLGLLMQRDENTLEIDFMDLMTHNPQLSDDLLEQPGRVIPAMETAVRLVDMPWADNASGITIVPTNLPEHRLLSPGEIRQDHGGRYIGINGVLERVTSVSKTPQKIVWSCKRCDHTMDIPQDVSKEDVIEPHECGSCERQGPFEIHTQKSTWSDHAKIRVKAAPNAPPSEEGKVVGHALDDVLEMGGENGIIARAGEPVTIYGVCDFEQRDGRNENNSLFDPVLRVFGFDFEREEDSIDVEEHQDTFEQLAGRHDAVDLFAESIAPQLHATDAWDAAYEFAVAYLFGAPRIDIPKGPTYRGDLHFLIVSDYATGKSTFKEDIEAFSPQCISKSTTALASDVGLTAAAVKDDFGEGAWTLKPGLLVRASGGHLILDEIDKGPEELENMNDALEGKQQVDIEKAGESATYDSQTALLAMGNPEGGRFNHQDSISEQLEIPESLLSRFDGIVTMTDTAKVEQDEAVAEAWGRSYIEAQEYQYGDREEFDYLDRPVPIETGEAWVKYARENVNPQLRYEQFEELKTWYAEEVRQLNHGGDVGDDMPVPATVRELAAAAKMAVAFARVHLRDEVTSEDVERAKKLGKRLVKQNWTGDRFDATKNLGQGDRKLTVRSAIGRICQSNENDLASMEEVIAAVDVAESTIEHDVEKMKRQGDVVEPKHGCFRLA